MRQQRRRWRPKHRHKQGLLKDLVLVNGNWTRPSGNAGMTRQAGSFPRVEIHELMERSLAHRAEYQQQLRLFYSCKIDEYRTSKQLHKLWALLGDGWIDKTTPKVGTTATTTSNTTGEEVAFTVAEKRHKLQRYTGRDGTVRVVNRDEGTNSTFTAVYVGSFQNRWRPATISRNTTAHDKAARPGDRSRKARDATFNASGPRTWQGEDFFSSSLFFLSPARDGKCVNDLLL